MKISGGSHRDSHCACFGAFCILLSAGVTSPAWAGCASRSGSIEVVPYGNNHDGAHRLTGIADSLSNHITYTLDAMGSRIGEDVTDPSGQLAQP